MDRMIAKFGRFGGRAYHVGQDCAKLDPDPDFDSDEIKPDIQKPSPVAEFSCHQFTGGINFLSPMACQFFKTLNGYFDQKILIVKYFFGFFWMSSINALILARVS